VTSLQTTSKACTGGEKIFPSSSQDFNRDSCILRRRLASIPSLCILLCSLCVKTAWLLSIRKTPFRDLGYNISLDEFRVNATRHIFENTEYKDEPVKDNVDLQVECDAHERIERGRLVSLFPSEDVALLRRRVRTCSATWHATARIAGLEATT
jgi:hypothetical protein